MKSLDILEHIRKAPAFMGGDARYESLSNSNIQYEKDIEQIKKDLEVLNKIKNLYKDLYTKLKVKSTDTPNDIKYKNYRREFADYSFVDKVKDILEKEGE